MTLTELSNLLITNLTRVGSNFITGPEILQSCQAIVSYFATQIANIIPDWTNALTFNTDGSGAGAYCKHPDTNGVKRIFETKTSGNINNVPPTDPSVHETTHWLEVSASESAAIPEWSAGLYGPGLIIVFHNHSVDGRGLYVLLEPVRPFNSANIETEITAGKWEVLTGGGGSTPTLEDVLSAGSDGNGNGISNIADPVNPQDVDTKAARDAAIVAALEGIKWKKPVRVATTVAGNLVTDFDAGSTIDGVTLFAGNSILIKDQADQTINGVYVVQASGTPVRRSDADVATELEQLVVTVEEGTANANTSWYQTTDQITLSGSNIVFVAFGVTTPDATPSVKGKAKLYSNLSASNTDGAPDQASVVAGLALKENLTNKKTDLSTADNTGYPTTLAVLSNSFISQT